MSDTTFGQALEKLGIEDYSDRIFNSNSHGELFHMIDYIIVADEIGDRDASWFRPWFEAQIKKAKETWTRPESIYQHLIKLINGTGAFPYPAKSRMSA